MAVGWYLRFSLSYRDVEELLAERGLSVDHVTVWRWVQRYAPELERRLRRHLKPTNDSWRVDETYVRVKGNGCTCTGRWTPAVRRSTSFSAFPLVLVCVAHRRRLRSDSYDSQGPGVRERGGCEGRSSSPLHSRSVRGDELSFRSSTPIFVSTTNRNTSVQSARLYRAPGCGGKSGDAAWKGRTNGRSR